VAILILTILLVTSFARGKTQQSNSTPEVIYYPTEVNSEKKFNLAVNLLNNPDHHRKQGSDCFETDSGRGESIYAHLQ